MIEKKQFPVSKPGLEEEYLNQQAAKGYVFEKYENEHYVFKEISPMNLQYLVEYRQDPSDANPYQDQGFEEVFVYPSSHGGTFTYYVRPTSEEMIIRRNSDYVHLNQALLDKMDSRYLPLAFFVLLGSIYMVVVNRNIFLFITVAILFALVVYLLYIRFQLKRYLSNHVEP